MAIDVSINCDECGGTLIDGDNVYCTDCIKDLKRQIEELEKDLDTVYEKLDHYPD
jgi:transcription initiation factor IIE alpha subunit